jgi:hypothetical protein
MRPASGAAVPKLDGRAGSSVRNIGPASWQGRESQVVAAGKVRRLRRHRDTSMPAVDRARAETARIYPDFNTRLGTSPPIEVQHAASLVHGGLHLRRLISAGHGFLGLVCRCNLVHNRGGACAGASCLSCRAGGPAPVRGKTSGRRLKIGGRPRSAAGDIDRNGALDFISVS